MVNGIRERPNQPPEHEVFFSYHSADREQVLEIRQALKERGITSFVDRECLVAGLPWPKALEDALSSVRAVVVFVGRGDEKDGLGVWQRREMWFALDRQAQEERDGHSFPVIPALLSGASPTTGFLFLNTWLDLRDTRDRDSVVDFLVSAIGGASASDDVPPAFKVCPFRALEAFHEEHAPLFFGRERVVDELLTRVGKQTMIALVGPSGSGKSSVIRAGLIPALRRHRPPRAAWDSLVFKPGNRPFHRLASSLIDMLEPEQGEVERLVSGKSLGDGLLDGSISLVDTIDRTLRKSNGTDRLLLVIDQFEEIFTQAPVDQREDFARMIVGALDRAPFTLLITLRADFYGHVIGLNRDLSDRLQAGVVNLGAMTPEELKRAIELPASKVGVELEPGLVERILDQLAGEPGHLALLEFALTLLWENCDGRTMTHAGYDAIGEVAGAISHRADFILLGLDKGLQRAALSLFTRLVKVADDGGVGTETRRQVELTDLTDAERNVVAPFAEARLLVLDRNEASGNTTVEVAHEALIRGWPRLGECIDQRRDFLLWRQRFDVRLEDWQRAGENKESLLRGLALREARRWERQGTEELSALERRFIKCSRRRQGRGRSVKIGLIALVLLVAAAWPAAELIYDSDSVRVWQAAHSIPFFVRELSPRALRDWIHAMDVAGRLDQVGEAFLDVPSAELRFEVLWSAALLLAEQGRLDEARALLRRADALTEVLVGYETSIAAQSRMAYLKGKVGEDVEARQFAHRAAALAREVDDPRARPFAVIDAAIILAETELVEEARSAISEARELLGDSTDTSARGYIETAAARAFAILGDLDEVLAIAGRYPQFPVPASVLEHMVHAGLVDPAHQLALKHENPMGLAIVASALDRQGRREEARSLAVRSLQQLASAPMAPSALNKAHRSLFPGLLLRLVSPPEAVAIVTGLDDTDGLAVLGIVLAEQGEMELSAQVAHDVIDRVARNGDSSGRWRQLTLATEALALQGDGPEALRVARGIEDLGFRVEALGHAAAGLISAGEDERALAVLEEADPQLAEIQDFTRRSHAWAVTAKARVKLGEYADALESGDLTPDPHDRAAVQTAIIRDYAIRENPSLRQLFDQGYVDGLGRLGIDWP